MDVHRDEASARQVAAAEPFASTWLSANAGSGKTRVLTDRVARLLLNGVAPGRVLCLTYTKAAAAEMQNRLFARLGDWAMKPDAELAQVLAGIGEAARGAEALARARRLFARAIETPGGLKIQTIHSFCAGLLRRFPLEAGVSPQFVEMDDRAARTLRAAVLEDMAEGDADARAALAGVVEHHTGAEIDALLRAIGAHAEVLVQPFAHGMPEALFDLSPGHDEAALLGAVFLGGEGALLEAVAGVMAGSDKVTDQRNAARMQALAARMPGPGVLPDLEALLLTGAGAKAPFSARIGALPTKGVQSKLGALGPQLDALMRRVEAARPRRIALAAAARARALGVFAQAFLPRLAAAKAARGWLDFDDLIARARDLLRDRGVAQWVLYKLDGGVDHILVDEAQDTAPAQWEVIALLAQEFTAGEGTLERSLFVVGDKKQSIYSFQGADLRVFEDMRLRFAAALEAVGVRLNQMELAHSFRSSDAVLRLVDQTFDDQRGLGLGGGVAHIAFHAAMPGRVELWPPVAPVADPEAADWADPVDMIPDEHHARQLARAIATHLRAMIDAGTPIPDAGGARALHEGDVLILVRGRQRLFHEIIRACKGAGLAIAGADRLQLAGEMAVRDLTALLRVLATPEDDLSLAATLRSPLFGWSEDALFRLAQGRGRAFLWERLRGGDSAARTMLLDLMGQADFLRPYELLERVLTRHDGRRRLLARLGPEAEDGIDALLVQALNYERLAVPSLTGFLTWLDSGAVEIKRQLDSAGRRIRVMTVHGAKGLEAPLVILPDTAVRQARERTELYALQGGVGWRASGANAPAIEAAREDARAREAEEDARLLYVAMTRAEKWLIVAAAGKTGDGACWHDRVAEGMKAVGAVRCETPTGPGLCFAHGDWPATVIEEAATKADAATLPGWLEAPVPRPPEAPVLVRPSDLGGAKALGGEADPEAASADPDALERGSALHLLLEHLPAWPVEGRAPLARDLLAAGGAGVRADWRDLLAEAEAVLSAPELAPVFAPGTLAEVDIAADLGAGRMLGTVDRLIVTPEKVLAVDFKSNRVIPECADDVPEGLLRQMGAYAAALAQVYPGRAVGCALLWTRAARLMDLPGPLMAAALARAGMDGEA
ncbi:MAG: double-strand break repair helicase AddA [Rhodobacteraceae bacterium]|nr:double-strand break repair helicase AddA [Paracoccaceae bacterium]